MKNNVFKAMIVVSAVAVIFGCGDDSSSPLQSSNLGMSSPSTLSSDSQNPVVGACAKYKVVASGWVIDIGGGDYLVVDQATAASGHGIVYDANGNVSTEYYFTQEGNIGHVYDREGIWIDLNMPVQMLCHANLNVNPGQSSAVVPGSSAVDPLSSNSNPGLSSAVDPIFSSSSVVGPNPGQSSAVVPASSSDAVPTSSEAESSSSEPELDANGFPTLESYGPPPAEYTKDISATARRGWNTRYWDACKPHCSWISDGQEGKTDTTTEESYQKGMTTARNCNIHDVEVPTFTVGSGANVYWFGYEGTNNACGNAKEKGVFTCTDMAPIAVNDKLSYGYVAGTANGKCGKCYHLQYDGSFKDAGGNNAPKETHRALKGKHMIVMASNIGHDVGGGVSDLPAGQFDLMVPGGGVGAFDALSTQVKGQNIKWGAGFGGFLTECQNQHGYDNTLEVYQQCVRDMCDAAFGNAGFPNLLRGCHWFADWFMAADNPTYYIEEVECPQYLIDHYMTRINTTKDNNYKWRDDWSTFKQGDVLDTAACWKDGENPHDPNGKGAGCEK